ncbi:MAG TPA: response regulator [Chitinophagales bacterium]|nr:response regulator [Chitinophagales bacterium]
MEQQQSGNEAIALRILHVDDDEDDRMFLADALKQLNFPYTLTGAKDGIELFTVMDAGTPYDLIFLDINMPVIDGRQCLKKLKAHEKYRDVPVIMFTVSKSEQDINEVYASGAHYHVVKPYSFMNMVATIKKILEIDWKTKPPVPSREDFLINYAFT